MKFFIKLLIIFYCVLSYADERKDYLKDMNYVGNGRYVSKGSRLVSETTEHHVPLPDYLKKKIK